MSSKDRRRERRSRSRSPGDEYKRKKLSESKRDRGDRDRGERGEKDPHFDRDQHRRREREESRADRGSPERRGEQNGHRRTHSRGNQRSSRRHDGKEKPDNTHGQNERTNIDRENFLGNADENTSESKEEPNFELSGKLTEYTNTYKGVVIKYNEPPEALKPKTRWRLYPFKGDKSMPVLYVHRQSAYLIGRQRHIVDLAVDHPSCSKQHAVLQYRLVSYERDDGTAGRRCKPYIIDLESANGTFLNNQKIEARRYYEVKEKDVLKFGFSSREYVLLHEKTKLSEADDDVELSPDQEQQNAS